MRFFMLVFLLFFRNCVLFNHLYEAIIIIKAWLLLYLKISCDWSVAAIMVFEIDLWRIIDIKLLLLG